jgi:hypothetical protein
MYVNITSDFGRTTLTYDESNGTVLVQPLNYSPFNVLSTTDFVVASHSEVIVYGNVRLTAERGSRIKSYGATVTAMLGSEVTGEHGSTVYAQNGSFITAYDGCIVEALPGSYVTVCQGASALVHPEANVTHYYGAIIRYVGGQAASPFAAVSPLIHHMMGR